MKKTLVIHPDDRSTDFLKIVYENHKEDWTILNTFSGSVSNLMDLISAHDRILMLGHGISYGLFNTGAFDFTDSRRGGYITLIDDRFVPILKEKETVSIWCHSDEFFRKHNMEGFHTGMIISEVEEALYVLGHAPLDREETEQNMIRFSEIVRDCIDMENPDDMREYVLEHYTGNDEVTEFNRKNILVLKKKF